jgi:hypothetical protein
MNSAVKIITGWMKLVAPPVANSESATSGIVAAVIRARRPSDMPCPRAAIPIEMRPQATANMPRPSARTMWSRSEPGSASTAMPKAPVAVHISPDVKSGRGPSSHRFPSACS